ncbi:cupin domain-containing protein [Flexistipes sp.]|uniref:cupin domain-containing protein n=1 Tax=Flexistipes sp. TaxID=3088135 RepID=UPI002E1D9F8C|nr:cupin domain-containing protein [Flexistipes sp.]
MIKRVQDIDSEEMKNPHNGRGSALRFAYREAAELNGKIKDFFIVDLQPDSQIGRHKHENNAEIYLMLDGVAVINDNGTEELLNPGDMLITRRGEEHSIENKSAAGLTFLAIIVE